MHDPSHRDDQSGSDLRFLYVTASSHDEALAIGRAVVEERLAACANVMPGMTSLYWWEGRIEEGSEAVLILKTRAELADRATARIRALHSYSCPCVVVLPVGGGNPDYLDWLRRETAEPAR